MLKKRIIPTLLWKSFGLVKGKSFESWRRIGTVLPAIKVYNKRDVDELILLDIDANQDNGVMDFNAVREFAENCFVPFSVGGGLVDIEQVRNLLKIGADKITLNSIIYKKPNLVDEVAKNFGSQSLIISIDAKLENKSYQLYSHSGQKRHDKKLTTFVRELEDRGAGEILITSVDRD